MIPFAANAAATAPAKIANAFEWCGQPFPPKMSIPLGDLHPHGGPHLIRGLVLCAHPSLHPKRHIDRFSRFCTSPIVSRYFTMRRYVSPPQIIPSFGGLGPSCNTWYIRPTQVIIPNGITIGIAVFEWPQMHRTMHCQWGGKPPKLPLPLRFRHPAGSGPSYGHRQHAQKNW